MPACCQCEQDFSPDDLGWCEACNLQVCFDCSKQSSGPWECIDYTICASCYDGRASRRRDEDSDDAERKAAIAAKAKASRNTPEAIARRLAKKAERQRLRREARAESAKRQVEALANAMAGFARFF